MASRPTQAGRTLLQHARTMLEQAERLREDLGAYAGGLAGQVRVLSNTNALTEFLPEALSAFLAAHPNVSVDLEERLSDEIVGLIAEGVGDIGIVAGTVDAGRLTTYPFRSDRFVLVVARDHPLAKRSKIGFAEVLDQDFVGLDRASAIQRFLGSKASQHRPAAPAARAVAQLRRGLPDGRMQCRRRRRAGHHRAAGGQEHGDQGGRSRRPLGAARSDDLRPRLRGAAALCAPARGAHAGGGELAAPRRGTRIALSMVVLRGDPPRRITMRISKLFGTVGAAALLAATVSMPVAAAEMANTQLKDSSGKAVGDVDLVQTPAGVLIKLQIKGLTPGEHAFHVHAVGKCEAPFESAGPHFNPGNHKHGMMSGEGHAGDMPNLHVPQSGELSVEVVNAAISLEKGKPNSVFDNDGSALVIHAKADDYRTDPAGNAGDRIACGVIQQSGAARSAARRRRRTDAERPEQSEPRQSCSTKVSASHRGISTQ